MNVRVSAVGEATSLADRKIRAGQRLVLGFGQPWLTDDERRLVREIRPGGFVVRRRNVTEPEQIRELLREYASLCDPHDPPLLGVDQEGGRVSAVGPPATEWPPMAVLGRSEGLTRSVGRAIAAEMHALGFNLLFGPVADVDRGGSAIGNRSFGSDPGAVASHVAQFVVGVQEAGLIACPKHFPGHGAADGDSHDHLPIAERDGRELRAVDLVPFRAAFEHGAACVMAAHVLYPEWDESWPASLSTHITEQILRTELGFDGVVISDDFDMAATARFGSLEIAECATAGAADLVMITDSLARQHALFEDLVRVQEVHPTVDRAAQRAVDRLRALRVRFFTTRLAAPPVTILGDMAHRLLAAEVADRGGG